ncbi:hypothetical protein CTAYLR_008573 [Chrysophaeum taylorii]|uniref:Sulfatase N-terminal domain-containing protein n=1 Tax=Chrysophaeum taylorii TaxID=2483200 RepID=A0AAD7UFI1_9STRA|nr:hypothetical protein CTAYLR_008573 [Chrysophaeum taylorii]
MVVFFVIVAFASVVVDGLPKKAKGPEQSLNQQAAEAAPPVDEKGQPQSPPSSSSSSTGRSGDHQQAPPPLGIVVAVVDDWGFGDVGYHDRSLHTPEIESLAASGIVLEQFYSACACTPSRAMLMTGRYNIRNGMQDSVIHSTEPRGVPLDEKFLPEKLREAGYATAGVGKWHLGMFQEAYLPENRGFDRWYGIYTGGGSHTGHFSVSQPFTVRGGLGASQTWQGYNLWEDLAPSPDNAGSTHSTHLYTRKAVEYVSTFVNNKWFLYLAYQAVHDPMTVGDDRYVRETPCVNQTDSARATLCGMVAEVDDGLKTLRLAIGEVSWSQTLMVVVSDNGGVLSHGSSNSPLRGEKGTYFEGGVRVPAVVSGGYVEAALAARGKATLVSTALSHLVDLHATILDLAAYDDDDEALDGQSLWSHLAFGEDPPRTELLLNLNSDLFAGSGALRLGNYKLVVNGEPNEAAVYSKVRKRLAAPTATLDEDTFGKILADAHAQAIGQTRVYLFDIASNPRELDDEDCENAPACRDLYDNPDYRAVRDALRARWAEYQREAAPSTFAWEDDGPLANPDNFGGVWAPWRDADSQPNARYVGTKGLPAITPTVTTPLQYSRTFNFAAADSTWATTASLRALTLTISLLSFSVGAVASWLLRPPAGSSAWRRLP